MRKDEFCEICGNGILYGHKTICEDCKTCKKCRHPFSRQEIKDLQEDDSWEGLCLVCLDGGKGQ